jgi:hypothetical protein
VLGDSGLGKRGLRAVSLSRDSGRDERIRQKWAGQKEEACMTPITAATA